MPLTRLDNLYSSKTGKYLYVSPDDFNATDELDNRGNSPLRPFKTIQRAFIEVSRYSYLPGKDNDRFDQFSIMLMPGNHFIDNRPGLVDAANPEARYFDAANLVEANTKQIIDRAAAEIPVQHPDFNYPLDDVTDEGSRYADAYRMIQLNRKEIVDRASGQISIDFPDFNFPGSALEDEFSRTADAYRLIQNNRQEIIDNAWNTMILSHPGVASVETKCKRDIGILIDSVALDVKNGGNEYARKFSESYFDAQGAPILNGINDPAEVNASVTAFEAARDEMHKAITNQLTYQDLTVTPGEAVYGDGNGDVPNTDPTACSDLQTAVSTLVAIPVTILQDGNLSQLPAEDLGTVSAGETKCKRDIGHYIDALSLDVAQAGGNVYTRKFLKRYFNEAGTDWITAGLQGEEQQSLSAFGKARAVMLEAITNQLYYKDLTVTPGDATYNDGTGTIPNNDPAACADIQQFITNLHTIVDTVVTDGNLSQLPVETVSDHETTGEQKCKRDIGYIVEAVIADLRNGGNSNIINATKNYFDRDGNPISNGLVGEVNESVTAFNKARDMMKLAVTNSLYEVDLTISPGPAIAGQATPDIEYDASGNIATCVDVQSSITTLVAILTDTLAAGSLTGLAAVQVTGTVPVFDYNRALEEWQDDSILDLSNPDNVLYKFNSTLGGAIVPRGCSLIGYDLRRTIVRPLYVPDPVDGAIPRTTIFNLTGGCYLWQFTIKDGDLSENSPLYDQVDRVGKVYNNPTDFTSLAIPEYSHHKICIMTYADNTELDRYYEKVGRAFAQFQPTIDDGDLEALVQENRIVGPLSDTRTIESMKIDDIPPGSSARITVTTKIDHGYFKGQYVAVINSGLADNVNGTFKVDTVDQDNPKVFSYIIPINAAGLGLVSGTTYTTANGLGTNGVIQAEIDSVESASPYVFNCSIRSTWGQCGMWADGSKATGFKSMVVAQYTGVSLQKDDRAFIRYDRFTNTWNQAALTDAFATIPYHAKGDAYWKDDWRNFHIRASDDAFIQCVSVFAVGFHDHFLMESGGDMSITNSNSNFGNTSLHAIGFKGFAFNQDKGGYIDAIVPPKVVDTSATAIVKQQYYTIDIEASNDQNNNTKLYLSGDSNQDPANRPAATINGYRIGAKNGEKLYVKMSTGGVGGKAVYSSELEPSGFTTYTTSLSTLTPAGLNVSFDLDGDGNDDFHYAQDAANQIERNRTWLQQEAYGYILDKYPNLLTNQNITITKCERDLGYFVDATVKDLRLGGNINTILAAEGYLVGGQLDFIDNELTETLEAYDYLKRLMIGAMRNFDFLIQNCELTNGSATATVGDTSGLVPGMRVSEYDQNDFINGKITPGTLELLDNISSQNVVIGEIVDSQTITMVEATTGQPYLAVGTTNTAWLYFQNISTFAQESRYTDNDIVQDTNYPECANIATAIQGYFDNINLILSGNKDQVVRVEAPIESRSLTGRATLFTVNTGLGQTDPHGLQTGTPVRLIPRALNDTVDKRLVRLPRGFETNTIYYVIAPGRDTYPYSFNTTPEFDTTANTGLLLAATKENAAAGIYIYSPETEGIDPNVELLIQQSVLDEPYDLHRYVCNVSGIYLETDIPHIFDKPLPNVPAQQIFFRTSADANSSLPDIAGGGAVPTDVYYYPRYVNKTQFSVHETQADAQAGTNAVIFTAGSGSDFIIYGDKKTSAMKFDASNYNRWYLNVKDESSGGQNPDAILTRLHDPDFVDGTGNLFTSDSWYERYSDDRNELDRIYRLRYVVPQYLDNVREPLNGYVIKTRTDDRRRLRPQKFVLEPYSSGAPPVAQFFNPSQPTEQLGVSLEDLDTAGIDIDAREDLYDPYENPLQIEFESKIAATVQSARTIENALSEERLEITAFDHTIINEGLKNEIFSIIEIGSPQGPSIQTDLFNSDSDNYVTWSGASTGSGYVHAYFPAPFEATAFIILKNVSGDLKFDQNVVTTFTQSNGTFWNMSGEPDGWNTIYPYIGASRSSRDNFLYRIEGANVYTLCPGDRVTTPGGDTYTVSAVNDIPDVEDTFYIFDVEEIQEVIPLQQDGIYYLTCVRGNISPYPLGAGVGTNFHYYRFSQPISNLYPLDFKNDPLWFQVQLDGSRDVTIVDPPASVAAADNYVHGLVTLNDYKYSETKEAVVDLLATDPLLGYAFTNTTSNVDGDVVDNRLRAQEGNASIGSENRKIPINGDSVYPLDGRFYVELRRPSIARSGNHTFEYLGFGPGNYSTGFPLRQEVVLSDKQDFYAQSKKEDGGIVFYTGLNSNGDLYIGNRKINAITGEETFLEQAVLADSGDDSDTIGSLVTTFDTAVTFNDKITVEGDSFFNNPVSINVDPQDGDALTILSLMAQGEDPTLDRSSFRNNVEGDIVITKNKVRAGVFQLNPRGNVDAAGQVYSIRTHYAGSLPSNISPNNSGLIANGGSAWYTIQNVTYGSATNPASGDILWKGEEIGYSGSLGSIYSNFYTVIPDNQIFKLTSDNSSTIRIDWSIGITNQDLKVKIGEQLRISNFSINFFSGSWNIITADPVENFCEIRLFNDIAAGVKNWVDEAAGAQMEISQSSWKETMVLGAEAIRTYTEVPGDYKLGINTIGRANQEAALTANVSAETDPRANLDVVGNAFISGRNLVEYDALGSVTTNNYLGETSTNKVYFPLTNAFLVGGDSADGNDFATLRVSTTDIAVADQSSTYRTGGRVGVNTSIGLDPSTELDRNFVVIGDGRMTGNLTLEDDLSVDGGDINSTSETFQFLTTDTDFFIGLSNAESIILGGVTTQTQTISIGDAVADTAAQTVRIGSNAGRTVLKIHERSADAVVDIATVTDNVTSKCDIRLGGGAPNLDTTTYIGTYQTKLAGTLEIAAFAGTSTARIFTPAATLNIADSSATTAVNLGSNASRLQIGSLGGVTTIRNSLEVLASAEVNGSLKLIGGLNAGIIEIERARFATSSADHIVGSLENPNITFLKYSQTGKVIDTAGQGLWGGPNYLLGGGQIAAIDNINPTQSSTWVANANYPFIEAQGGTGEGALFSIQVLSDGTALPELVSPGSGYSDNDLLTIPAADLGNPSGDDLTFQVSGVNSAGNLFNLPISQPSVADFKIGDLILIDRGDAASPDSVDDQQQAVAGDQSQNEIVEVVGLTNITNPNDPNGFRLAVSRSVLATTARQDHPDGCVLNKLDQQTNASFITGFDFDSNGEIDPVSSVLVLDNQIQKIALTAGSDIAEITWQSETNSTLNIDYGEFIRISGTSQTELNGDWPVQSSIVAGSSVVEVKINAPAAATEEYLWTDLDQGGGEIRVQSASGLLADTANVRIGVAEFGGVLTTNDYLLLTGTEIVKVVDLATTDIQSFIVTDGGEPESVNFKIESTTGNTFGSGDLNFGQGFNKFVVDGPTGNTDIAGTLTTENTLTINGSTIENREFFTITNGGSTGTALRTTFQIDTATGNVTMNGGNINVFGVDGTTPRLTFNNSSGDFTTYGSFSALGSGTSKFGGAIQIGGAFGTTDTDFPYNAAADLTINGGDLTINQAGDTIFSVENDGRVNIAGISNYFTPSGGRKWLSSESSVVVAEANTNYFLNVGGNTVVKLPPNAQLGDMIRIIDIGGNLTYNTSLVIRAETGESVQNSTENTGTTLLSGISANDLNGYNGGELVVQTPYAGFALVYAGSSDPDGNTAVSPARTGWYLLEV
ncbi:short tail fiber protein [Synechococcus phage S-CAM3]|uniref:Tail protein n=1 Tax=Synechococcus phage S-CAM3 TaxID=1883366 RepID=A0A1D8KK62_9CAUD|nr:short tail fiber protein [Synechococcus phage S-CAM3]AOV58526.1 tail protein [Synechococcus phage S-CAM3]AOV59004.1 tail protein [Synechococcus phage S-CAM3]